MGERRYISVWVISFECCLAEVALVVVVVVVVLVVITVIVVVFVIAVKIASIHRASYRKTAPSHRNIATSIRYIAHRSVGYARSPRSFAKALGRCMVVRCN